MHDNNKKITVIGAGHMGYAIVHAAIRSGYKNLTVYEKNEQTLLRLNEKGIDCCQSGVQAIKAAEIIILAVKPNILSAVADEIADAISDETVIVSVCAGVSVSSLQQMFRHKKTLRVMPNNLLKVNAGMCVICQSDEISSGELDYIKDFFSAGGKVEILPESLIDTVTGISGSGPAYAYMLIEGMIRAGIRNGLDEESAKILASQTVLGAAKTVLEGGTSPAELITQICTPNGTTIEAVKVFEECGLYNIIDKAIAACINRSKELSHQ